MTSDYSRLKGICSWLLITWVLGFASNGAAFPTVEETENGILPTTLKYSGGTLDAKALRKAVGETLTTVLKGHGDQRDFVVAPDKSLEANVSALVAKAILTAVAVDGEWIFASIGDKQFSARVLAYTIEGEEIRANADRPTDGVRIAVTLRLSKADCWRLHHEPPMDSDKQPPAYDPEIEYGRNRNQWEPAGVVLLGRVVAELRPRSSKVAAIQGAGWSITPPANEMLAQRPANQKSFVRPTVRDLWMESLLATREERPKILESLSEAGSREAMTLLGASLAQNDASESAVRAAGLLARAADGGSREASLLFAQTILRSDRAAESVETLRRAKDYFERAAAFDDLEARYSALLVDQYISNRFVAPIIEAPTGFQSENCPAMHVVQGKISAWRAKNRGTAGHALARDAYLHFLSAARLGGTEGALLAARCEATAFGATPEDAEGQKMLVRVSEKMKRDRALDYPLLQQPKELARTIEELLRACQEVTESSQSKVEGGAVVFTALRWPNNGTVSQAITAPGGPEIHVTLRTDEKVTNEVRLRAKLRSLALPATLDQDSRYQNRTVGFGAPWWGSGKENGSFIVTTNNTYSVQRKDGAKATVICLHVLQRIWERRQRGDGSTYLDNRAGKERGVLVGAAADLSGDRFIQFFRSTTEEDWVNSKALFDKLVENYNPRDPLPEFTTVTPIVPL